MPVNSVRGEVKLGAASPTAKATNKPAQAPTSNCNSIRAANSTTQEFNAVVVSDPPAPKEDDAGKKRDTGESKVSAILESKAPTDKVVPSPPKKEYSSAMNMNKGKTPPKSCRRTIFSQYKRQDSNRSSLDDSSTHRERNPADILEFSPPLDHRYDLQKRFTMLEKFPLEKAQELPPLPTPLLRYTNEGSATGGGCYPMIKPVSILRQGKFSPDHRQRSSSTLSSDDACEDAPAEAPWYTSREPCSNDNAQHRPSLSDFERVARDLNLEETKRFFRNQQESDALANDRQTLVKFDPRIVITEFPDDGKREWFTEDDLNRFKHETIMLIRHYMMLHPELVEEYNAAKIDPVTGTVRKKALYAMPGLCSAAGLESFGTSDEIESLLKNAVQRILIVDPNKAILDLFQKSTQQIFPDANISIVQTGEEALRLFSSELERQKNSWDGHNHGFDIVIVEEQLNRRRIQGGRKRSMFHSARMVRMNSESTAYPNSSIALRALPTEGNGLPKQDSLFNLRSISSPERDETMTGSELIQQIRHVEDRFFNLQENNTATTSSNNDDDEDSNSDPPETSVFSPPQRLALFIGVSVNVERDSQKLNDSGADLVWGKPPPTMDERLRFKLISALIAKRQKASFCIKL